MIEANQILNTCFGKLSIIYKKCTSDCDIAQPVKVKLMRFYSVYPFLISISKYMYLFLNSFMKLINIFLT